MPFVKEERFNNFWNEVNAHADKTDKAIDTLGDDVRKLRAELKNLNRGATKSKSAPKKAEAEK
tara:strand:+ start:3496 stop:3684 length:189 start_codon:yes stop_codon:yes gene_type:complete